MPKSWLRDPLSLAVALAVLAVGSLGLAGSAARVGEPFPGFLVLENRVVASIGLCIWPATADGALFQRQVTAIGERRVESARDVHAAVAGVPLGTPLAYRLRGSDGDLVRAIETRRFGIRDFLLLYGLYLLNGSVLAGAALVALAVRRSNPSALSTVPILALGALWTLTALDLYGPYRLFRLHALCEALLFPACLHMALGFPQPARVLRQRPWLPWAAYGLAGVLAALYQLGLNAQPSYSLSHLASTSALGVALLVLMVSEVERYRRTTSAAVRERIRTIAVGAVLALSLPVCLTIAELFTGGRAPQNAMALTTFLFPLAVGYAVLTDARLGLRPARAGSKAREPRGRRAGRVPRRPAAARRPCARRSSPPKRRPAPRRAGRRRCRPRAPPRSSRRARSRR
jgi:hypothetical protein